MEDVQDLREIEMPKDQEHNEEKGDEQGERQLFFFNSYSCENSTAAVTCFFLFPQERPHHKVRRSALRLPAIWPLRSSNGNETRTTTISPTLLTMTPCQIEDLEEVPLRTQTNKLFHYGRACAHICLVVTKNAKPHD